MLALEFKKKYHITVCDIGFLKLLDFNLLLDLDAFLQHYGIDKFVEDVEIGKLDIIVCIKTPKFRWYMEFRNPRLLLGGWELACPDSHLYDNIRDIVKDYTSTKEFFEDYSGCRIKYRL